jgi:peptidoglycan/LPS O-acetylase OafA/YrhL
MDQSRIKVIDGLRTLAVLGVLWAHNWSFWFNQPKFLLLGIDIHRLLSVGGTGVNLFFVISGFCMYLMYGKRASTDFSTFISFVKNRYIRIAPACMASVIITGLWFYFKNYDYNWVYALPYFATFTNPFFGYGGLFPHYWSLSTEWQFYLLLPIFFISQRKYGFVKTLAFFITACLLFKFFIFAIRLPGFVEYTRHEYAEVIKTSIFYRFIEFSYGILICYLFSNNVSLPKYLRGTPGLVLGILLLFVGRTLDTTEVINKFLGTGMDIVLRVGSFPILTLGYATITISLLYSNTIFTKIVSSRIMTSIGKVSYSMYLWHWLIGKETATIVKMYLSVNATSMWVAYGLEIIILFPVSLLSYNLFEKFYFNRSKQSKQIVVNLN